MSPKYADEFLKFIQEASFDEKVAVLLRGSESPIVLLQEVTEIISKLEHSGTDKAVEEWDFLTTSLIRASSHLKKALDQTSQRRRGEYDPEADLAELHEQLLQHRPEADLSTWPPVGLAELLTRYSPESALWTLRNEFITPIGTVKGVAALLGRMDLQSLNQPPEGLNVLIDALNKAGDDLAQILEIVTGPLG